MSLVDEIRATAPQGTAEWEKLRCGKFTASEIYRLMTEPRSKADKEAGNLSDGAETYVWECIGEIITGEPMQTGWSQATQWGEDHEHEAREHFVEITGKNTWVMKHMKPISAYLLNEHACGTTDDEIIGEDAILEVKCPFNPGIHARNLTIDTPEKLLDHYPIYYWQDMFNMMAGKKTMCYHVSYDPRCKKKAHRMGILNVPYNTDAAVFMMAKINKAIQVKKELLSQIENK